VHDTTEQIEQRVDRFVRERIAPAVERRATPLDVEAWEVPGEPVPFAEAVQQAFTPVDVGTPWSRPWGTTWFRAVGRVPDGWGAEGTSLEVEVDLGFTAGQAGFQAEGLVFRPDGTVVKGLEPLSSSVPVTAAAGERVDLYVEAASNPDIGSRDVPTPLGDRATAGTAPLYTLRRLDLVERDVETYALLQDCWTLVGLVRELDPTSPRRARVVRALDRMVDAVDPDEVAATAAQGRAALAEVLASPAHASAHRVVAVGHAHIDSAWLWPTRETVRKCARTFANVLALMDDYPGWTFACSSAQQYAWVQRHYPELFERLRERVAEGRFVPVGGMWVESDTNMPGGEALVRQFVHGKGYFLRELGVEPTEVWLPDSFGYSAAMPQIARAAGCDSFLTQKMSWSETNRMPHHSFLWEGIDGTRIFTHFPPVDTYNSDLSGADLARAQRQFAEKAEAATSLVPFGFGDGGGGPTREMLEAAARTADLEGSPVVALGTPAQFFERAKAELPEPAVWSGEMYLELHRGTYTSQVETKRGNRRNEHLLREAELWSSTATARGLLEYPYDDLQEAWEAVLLLQFHDILPGSSIAWVHEEAERTHARVTRGLQEIVYRAQRALAGEGDREVCFNAAPVDVAGVPALGAGEARPAAPCGPVPDGDGWVLENGAVRARFDADGLLVSFVDTAAAREVVPAGQVAALLQVFRDTPTRWDAWDVDVHYRQGVDELREAVAVEVEAGALVVTRAFRSSRFVQRFWLEDDLPELQVETRTDWHEHGKLVKLAFPLAVHADRAASEVQFGHVERPTHANTSWDAARFETVAHRWVHVGEPGFGAAVANDGTYGHDVTRGWSDDGATFALVRESLLRGPRYPDPEADQGVHVQRTTLCVAPTVLDAVAAGYRANLPRREVRGAGPVEPLVRSSDPAVVVEAVKLAEDRSGDLVVRLYEARGGRARTAVTFGVPVSAAWTTDLLERDRGQQRWDGDGAVDLELRPFEIVTLRVRLAPAAA